MLINRKNYEDFFLLYADGELCINVKQKVEEFIEANPDLKPELNMLLAAILPAETIVFPEKVSLYKKEIPDISMQENLLLLIDGELPEKEMADMNILLKTDDALHQEYTLLLQTKLALEKTVFPDKHLLYREEKSDPVFLPYIRWAAAAAILGFGLFVGLSRLNTNKEDVAVNNITPAPITTADVQPVKKDPIVLPHQVEKTPVVVAKNKIAKIPDMYSLPTEPTVKNIPVKTKDNSSSLKKPVDQELVKTDKKISPEQVLNPQTENISQSIASVKTSPDNSIPVQENKISEKESAIPNAQSLVSVGSESPNKIFYIDEDEVRRSRPFGILKKVKTFVERTANLKPGNTLRIAGFEFKGS